LSRFVGAIDGSRVVLCFGSQEATIKRSVAHKIRAQHSPLNRLRDNLTYRSERTDRPHREVEKGKFDFYRINQRLLVRLTETGLSTTVLRCSYRKLATYADMKGPRSHGNQLKAARLRSAGSDSASKVAALRKPERGAYLGWQNLLVILLVAICMDFLVPTLSTKPRRAATIWDRGTGSNHGAVCYSVFVLWVRIQIEFRTVS
jgi:hypothetical protein